MKQTIYIDLDGVLANWTLGMCRANNIPYPVNSRLKAYSLDSQLTRSQVDAAHTPLKYWTDLEIYPWAKELVKLVNNICPHWQFLTKACVSDWCFSGKAIWVSTHFPAYTKKLMILRGNKAHAGKPGDILIDDHPSNISDWDKMGGKGFRWHELTDDYDYSTQFKQLEQFLLKNYTG